ncbi:16619_t:CDS:2 [Rhizophagus irregularis]|nr:16619_t:CDS:2 [Rhizophagus irregularis]
MDGFNWEVPVKVSINMDNVQLEHGILHKRLEWFDVTEFVKEYIKTTSTFDDEVSILLMLILSSFGRSSSIFSAIEFIFKCNNVDLDVDDDKVIVDFAEVAHGSGVGANVGDEVAPIGKK